MKRRKSKFIADAGIQELPPAGTGLHKAGEHGTAHLATGAVELRLCAQQLSLHEQLERNHFLLKRLNASSARLLLAIEEGDVFEAIAEIIANLIGSEEVAVFHFDPTHRRLSPEWSCGVDEGLLDRMTAGGGMMGRAVHDGFSQFRNFQPESLIPPHEKTLSACVVLKSGQEVTGAIAIFGLLPQKPRLEWADLELLRFLEIYGSVALQIQRLEKKVASA